MCLSHSSEDTLYLVEEMVELKMPIVQTLLTCVHKQNAKK